MAPDDRRFRDGREVIYDFLLEPVLVKCPRCGNKAEVRPQPRRMTCPSCTLVRKAPGSRLSGLPADPWLQCELWLSVPFRGKVLWAYNARHLAFLREYVSATLRERGPDADAEAAKNTTVASRLPAWIKAAGNRKPLLALIDDLERRL